MEESKDHEIEVTVTCRKLVSLAECSCRMTGYADPDGKRLIAIMQSQDGTPVRLVLDQQCILTDCIKAGVFHACALSALRSCEKLKNLYIINEKEAVACLGLENPEKQRSRTKG